MNRNFEEMFNEVLSNAFEGREQEIWKYAIRDLKACVDVMNCKVEELTHKALSVQLHTFPRKTEIRGHPHNRYDLIVFDNSAKQRAEVLGVLLIPEENCYPIMLMSSHGEQRLGDRQALEMVLLNMFGNPGSQLIDTLWQISKI